MNYTASIRNYNILSKLMKIIFMGSSTFAAPALNKLANSNHNILSVYTKPPSCAGRGLREIRNCIHELSDKLNFQVFTNLNERKNDDIENFLRMKPDIVVVVSYGVIIPEALLNIPKFGFINLHPSDLPRWRGAAPIQRTIMSGDKKTAICVIKIDQGLDSGDILLREEIILDDKVTAQELQDYCANTGGDMILKVLNLFEENKINYIKQNKYDITYASKILAEEKLLNFHLGVNEVNNKIRAFSPKPGAYFMHNNEKIKIISAKVDICYHDQKPGVVVDNNLGIACKNGILRPTLLQRQGKKMIYTEAFLRGFKIMKGDQMNLDYTG